MFFPHTMHFEYTAQRWKEQRNFEENAAADMKKEKIRNETRKKERARVTF